MATVRVFPDDKVQQVIIDAAGAFEERLEIAARKFDAVLASKARLIKTERKIIQEMY